VNNKQIEIAGRKVGNNRPYIIAELSANHNGDIDRAYSIMEHAKKAGADAIKIQSYTADTLTIKSDQPEFMINGGLWDGYSLYELYEWAAMPWEWHSLLFEKARELDITIFSSPFDFSAVDMLEDLNAPAYKIASFECIDLPLISYVAKTGKPMIISTGMADAEEIEEAVSTARSNGCTQLALLHCVSGYPAPAKDYNLKTIEDMIERFDVVAGLSDHTVDNVTALASVMLGASIIEKHITLDRNGGGPDDSFSLEPKELEALVRDCRTAWDAYGAVSYERKDSEKGNAIFRRSLYVVNDIKKGEIFTDVNVRSIRPGYGLMPKHYAEVIGKRAVEAIPKGTALKWELIE